MLKQWDIPPLMLLSSPPIHPLLLLLLMLITAMGAGSGGALGCVAAGAGGIRAACLGGLWSRRSPGTQWGVLGTFPLLSSFNYGPIMKAARSVTTHHTLRAGGGRSRPPSPPLVSSFLPSSSLLPVMLIPLFRLYTLTSGFPSDFICSFQRFLFLYASSLFHLSAFSLICLCADFVFFREKFVSTFLL